MLSYQSIKRRGIISPWCERTTWEGLFFPKLTYGCGANSYDVRIDYDKLIGSNKMMPGEFMLASTLEHFTMPTDVTAVVHDKSSLIRCGLAVHNTLIDAGWVGFLTVELKNESHRILELQPGMPIAQIAFHPLDEPTEKPYSGKYQHQERGPQSAR